MCYYFKQVLEYCLVSEYVIFLKYNQTENSSFSRIHLKNKM